MHLVHKDAPEIMSTHWFGGSSKTIVFVKPLCTAARTDCMCRCLGSKVYLELQFGKTSRRVQFIGKHMKVGEKAAWGIRLDPLDFRL